ncbi:Hsp20/alpha crystallin family protein [Acidobacteriota bacterium]
MVKQYEEFMDVTKVQEDINRLFDQLMSQPDQRITGGIGFFTPNADILETADEVMVRLEIPGVEPDDLDLTLTGSTLTVSGVKKAPLHDDKGVTFVCMERKYGKFTRSLYVNFPINTHKATGEFKAGVLTVRIPKVKDRRGERISIPIKGSDGTEEENE